MFAFLCFVLKFVKSHLLQLLSNPSGNTATLYKSFLSLEAQLFVLLIQP